MVTALNKCTVELISCLREDKGLKRKGKSCGCQVFIINFYLILTAFTEIVEENVQRVNENAYPYPVPGLNAFI